MRVLSLLVLPLGVAFATTFQAYYSPDCTSGEGKDIDVKGGGRCSTAEGRFSYKVWGDDCRLHVYNNPKECAADSFNRTYYLNDGECLMNVPPIATVCIIGVHDNAADGIGSCKGVKGHF